VRAPVAGMVAVVAGLAGAEDEDEDEDDAEELL
jgi:hypothetical protein